MPSKFAQAFEKKAGKVFDKAKAGKTHRSGKSFGPADVPDGSFTAVVTARADVIPKGKYEGCPVVEFIATINAGTHEGKEPRKSFFCEGKPPVDPKSTTEFPTAEQQLIGLLEFLLPDLAVESMDDLEAAIEEINRRGPVVTIGVRNREVKNTATGKVTTYQDVFFNKVLEEASFKDAEEAPAEPAGTTQETTPDPDPSDYAPAKGDIVMVEGLDGEWEVTQVSQSRQTANLKNGEGTRSNGIPWTDMMLV